MDMHGSTLEVMGQKAKDIRQGSITNSLGEVVFGEPGTEEEEAIETLLINPEDLAGIGIFDFNVDIILENV